MAGGAEPAGLPEAAAEPLYEGEDADRSLLGDVQALIEDGKTYLEAELAYQKTRVGFVASGARDVAMYGALAAVFALLALVGLTVGLIIALTPLITAWGATSAVVGALLLGAFVCVRMAAGKWRGTMAAASDTEPAP
jgi:hypothetical protein